MKRLVMQPFRAPRKKNDKASLPDSHQDGKGNKTKKTKTIKTHT